MASRAETKCGQHTDNMLRPLPGARQKPSGSGALKLAGSAALQGLTLVHFSAQSHSSHFLWDTLGGVSLIMTKAAQVELTSGRVQPPAAWTAEAGVAPVVPADVEARGVPASKNMGRT